MGDEPERLPASVWMDTASARPPRTARVGDSAAAASRMAARTAARASAGVRPQPGSEPSTRTVTGDPSRRMRAVKGAARPTISSLSSLLSICCSARRAPSAATSARPARPSAPKRSRASSRALRPRPRAWSWAAKSSRNSAGSSALAASRETVSAFTRPRWPARNQGRTNPSRRRRSTGARVARPRPGWLAVSATNATRRPSRTIGVASTRSSTPAASQSGSLVRYNSPEAMGRSADWCRPTRLASASAADSASRGWLSRPPSRSAPVGR